MTETSDETPQTANGSRTQDNLKTAAKLTAIGLAGAAAAVSAREFVPVDALSQKPAPAVSQENINEEQQAAQAAQRIMQNRQPNQSVSYALKDGKLSATGLSNSNSPNAN